MAKKVANKSDNPETSLIEKLNAIMERLKRFEELVAKGNQQKVILKEYKLKTKM